jgi:hypothetical protein
MTKLVDISSLGLNAVADCEIPYKMPVKRADGSLTALVLHVIGQHADAVEKWNASIFTQWQRDEMMAKRKNKEVEPKSLDEYKQGNIEGALVRIVGWEGVSNEFSKDKMRELLANNPHLRDDVIEASTDLTNFTRTA